MTRPTRTLTSAAALGLLAATAIASPALAKPAPVVYDALGDSYAAGVGAPEGFAYPELLDGRMKIDLEDFVAEGGDKIGDLPAQIAAALDDETDLVSVSIGGNDIPWVPTLGICLVADDAVCLAAINAVTQNIGQVGFALAPAYDAIRMTAPDAHVVVTGYPRFFSPEFGPYVVPTPQGDLEMSVVEQSAANDAADMLNDAIAAAAEEAGFQFVDVTHRFIGHGVNAPSPWIVGVGGDGAFHPNTQGYRSYTAALTAAINPRDLR